MQRRRVLITGAARRLGRCLALAAADAGYEVVVHCWQSQEAGKQLVRELPGTGHRLMVGNLSSEFDRKQLTAVLPFCDCLINNAAVFFRPDSEEERQFLPLYQEVNFLAPLQLLNWWSAHALPGGAALNILDAVIFSRGCSGPYCESKLALYREAEKLVPHYLDLGLRINNLAPGPMLPAPWAADNSMRKIRQEIPGGEPVDIKVVAATAIQMLGNTEMTGNTVVLDRGWRRRICR